MFLISVIRTINTEDLVIDGILERDKTINIERD